MSHQLENNVRRPTVGAAHLLILVTTLLIGLVVLKGTGTAQPVGLGAAVAGAANPTLVTHVVSQPGKASQLIVVDTQRKAVAVYTIHPDSGEIALVSVRNITWDLQIENLNSDKLRPPKDIREGL